MSRLVRARLWLGAAGLGAVVFATSLAAMLRSCERAAHADTLSTRLAAYWRSHEASPR